MNFINICHNNNSLYHLSFCSYLHELFIFSQLRREMFSDFDKVFLNNEMKYSTETPTTLINSQFTLQRGRRLI